MITTRQTIRGRLAAIWADVTNAHYAMGHITLSEQAAAPISPRQD